VLAGASREGVVRKELIAHIEESEFLTNQGYNYLKFRTLESYTKSLTTPRLPASSSRGTAVASRSTLRSSRSTTP
jgi:hypothetical protein